ncbi:MAG: GNAT family N-acetyltransferase [Candidatus Dormibacterales bacterium]
MVADVWEGEDYLPRVFDGWVADPGAWFQGAELEGELVGLQRLRPLAPRLVWYEGLRVASRHRRRGIARAMLGAAVRQAAGAGFGEMRLATGNPGALALFLGSGFTTRVSAGFWEASRLEGGEPARIPPAGEAAALAERVALDPALQACGGLAVDFGGAHDLGPQDLERLLAEGSVRVAAGGRALAVVRPSSAGTRMRVTFLSGRGGGARDLLTALRYEADADDLEGVTVVAPPGHPAAGDLAAVGYDLRPDWTVHICSKVIQS